jgi:hypothetical protein
VAETRHQVGVSPPRRVGPAPCSGLHGFAPTVNVAGNTHPGPWQVDIFVTKPDGQSPTDSAFQFVAAQVSN